MCYFAFRILHHNNVKYGRVLIVVAWMHDGTVSCWSWTNSLYVFIAACEWSNLTVLLIGVRRSMKQPCAILKAVIISVDWCSSIMRSQFHSRMMSKIYTAMVIYWDSVCVNLRSLNRNRIFICHFAFRIHYNNVDNGPALIFVGWLYETGVVLDLDEQSVRLYCCVCGSEALLVFDAVEPMRPHHLISTPYVILLSECTAML